MTKFRLKTAIDPAAAEEQPHAPACSMATQAQPLQHESQATPMATHDDG